AEHIDNDSIRYAPPERLEGQPEGPSADTYSLTVIAYELITGRPLFDQKDGKAMWESVKMAEGVQRVLDTKSLPKKVRDVLANALIYDPDARLSGEAFVETIGGLLDDASIEGRTLSDVMMRMGQTARKSSRKLVNVKATATAAFTPADLKAMAEAESDDDDDDLDEAEAETEAEGSGSGQQRWGAVTRERTTGRGRRKPGEKAPQRERRSRREEPEADEADLAVPRRRRRRGTEAALESEAPRRRRRAEDLEARDREGADDLDETDDAEDEDEDEEATQGPARSRGGARDDATNPVVPRSSDGEDDEGSDGEFVPRRRRRRNADPDADLEPVPDDPDQPPADEELPRRRRRRTEDSQAVPAGPRDSASSSAPPEKAPSLPDLKTTAPGKAEPNPVPVEKPAEKAVETPPAQTSGAKAAPPEVKPPEDPKSAAVADARVDAPAGAGATAEALEDGDSPRRRRRRSIDDATADVPSIDANATSVGPASAGVIPDDPGNDDGEISPRRRRRRMGADVEAPVEGADPIDTKTLADGLNDDPPDGDPAPRRRRRRES
ncbi:MAG: hypothetical protein R3F61_04470, partial [Myxococcota bacterium]